MCASVVERIKSNQKKGTSEYATTMQGRQPSEERETDITTTSHSGSEHWAQKLQLTVGCKYRQPTAGVSTVPNDHNRVHVARMVVLLALMLTAPDEQGYLCNLWSRCYP